MKTIILFRHSESSWDSQYGGDHERHLTDNGIETAKKMGLYLSKIQSIPDLIISSTALRAKSTAEYAKKHGNWNSDIQLNNKIYGGDPNFLIGLAQKQNNKINILCLTGHEPHFSSFICNVINKDHIYFPTASIAKIIFMVEDWKKIEFYNAELDWLIKPKDISQI